MFCQTGLQAAELGNGQATLWVNGEQILSYDYGAAFTYVQVGLRLQNAHTHFDWVVFEPEAEERVVEVFTHRPHAVRVVTPTVGAADRFSYDPNGNMVLRVEVSATTTITYEQAFDVENRLTAVTATQGVVRLRPHDPLV